MQATKRKKKRAVVAKYTGPVGEDLTGRIEMIRTLNDYRMFSLEKAHKWALDYAKSIKDDELVQALNEIPIPLINTTFGWISHLLLNENTLPEDIVSRHHNEKRQAIIETAKRYKDMPLVWQNNYENPHIAAMESLDDETKVLYIGAKHIGYKTLNQIEERWPTDEIREACAAKREIIKANRKPPKRKVKPPEVRVKKLKHRMAYEPLGLKGVEPVAIVGKASLLMYDCDKRKLTFLFANEGGFDVTGTTIINVREARTKAIRVPHKVVPAFKRIAVSKALYGFEAIKAKEKEGKTRTNDNTIFLRVWNDD